MSQTNQAGSPSSHQSRFLNEIDSMLVEKRRQYSERGGFFETNEPGSYGHAVGEAILKLREFNNTGDIRMLIKAATWIYLIYEMEINSESQSD